MIDNALLKAAVDSFGSIIRVEVDDPNPPTLSLVKVSLDMGSVVVKAIADDDSIAVSANAPQGIDTYDVSHVPPWHRLIGAHILWVWTLENHQGYVDGIQFFVRADVGDSCVQLVAIASSLKPYVVLVEEPDSG